MKNVIDHDFRWKLTKIHFGVIGAAMLFMLSLLAQNTQYRDLSNKIVDIERDKITLEQERMRLNIRREQLSDPARIRSLAVERLGMIGVEADRLHEIRAEGER